MGTILVTPLDAGTYGELLSLGGSWVATLWRRQWPMPTGKPEPRWSIVGPEASISISKIDRVAEPSILNDTLAKP